jgi:DNA repair exonuclease SbcCD ATPase subunit
MLTFAASGIARSIRSSSNRPCQRFRVAVSLALAIGQYANGRGAGECVVIDEGFGSLDSDGQEIMIEELQRLKGIMQRIVLVSHQEAFANAFAHGYRFSLEHGQTRVSRL